MKRKLIIICALMVTSFIALARDEIQINSVYYFWGTIKESGKGSFEKINLKSGEKEKREKSLSESVEGNFRKQELRYYHYLNENTALGISGGVMENTNLYDYNYRHFGFKIIPLVIRGKVETSPNWIGFSAGGGIGTSIPVNDGINNEIKLSPGFYADFEQELIVRVYNAKISVGSGILFSSSIMGKAKHTENDGEYKTVSYDDYTINIYSLLVKGVVSYEF